jgi:hypothetical protein
MSNYEVGYGKPPLDTRWKKGQSGNPKRKRRVKMPSIVDMIDDQLAQMVSTKGKGASRRRTKFEIILLRLLPEIAHGNKKAMRIHKKYQAYAQARPTIVNVVQEDPGTPEEAAAAFYAMLEPKEPPTKEEIEYDEACRQLTAVEAAEVYQDLLNSINNED